MNKFFAVIAVAALGAAGAQSGVQVGQSGVELGLTGGYSGGLGAEGFVHVPEVAGPFGVKVSGSYTSADLINDSAEYGLLGTVGDAKADGLVTEAGRAVVLGVDGTYRLGQLAPGADATLYAGGRYGMFSGTVSPTDGSDSAVYSSNALGVGGGLQVAYPVANNVSLVGDLGVDQFFKAPITYSQGDQSDTAKPGDGANYEVKDEFLSQPGTVFKAKVGVKFSL
ncbi:hypothetical protein [Deinococcus radiophilus]|uniref:Outer membrane protein beta-barrel domain-containing protein n=1 Tax=Deinococcus radiophilus TaxID=32062 RepID=A0A3S0KF73_9DEIO|nr:hypothetical protein [Deinococcus radiophilus]RTR29467.1 hypothetical protein EJ104_03515 [Deinococcus radiophilus]UFA50698.1 hypothetical protein LMT64_01985 [Deinococcus radiophilus]